MKTQVRKESLPRAFRRKLVRALRSGRYSQSEKMYDAQNNSYNPLGVAYRLVGVDKTRLSNRKRPLSEAQLFLPDVLVGHSKTLDKINAVSQSGKSFKWIASYIEDNL
jgi:hypothetical protein